MYQNPDSFLKQDLFSFSFGHLESHCDKWQQLGGYFQKSKGVI